MYHVSVCDGRTVPDSQTPSSPSVRALRRPPNFQPKKSEIRIPYHTHPRLLRWPLTPLLKRSQWVETDDRYAWHVWCGMSRKRSKQRQERGAEKEQRGNREATDRVTEARQSKARQARQGKAIIITTRFTGSTGSPFTLHSCSHPSNTRLAAKPDCEGAWEGSEEPRNRVRMTSTSALRTGQQGPGTP